MLPTQADCKIVEVPVDQCNKDLNCVCDSNQIDIGIATYCGVADICTASVCIATIIAC